MITEYCFCGLKLNHEYISYSNLDRFMCDTSKDNDADPNMHCTYFFLNKKLKPYGEYNFQYGDNEISFLFLNDRMQIILDSYITNIKNYKITDFSYNNLVKIIDNLEDNKVFI